MTNITPLDSDDMSPDEEDEYEVRKQRALKSLESAATDLTAIRTKKLYRHKYKTWQLFCQGELGITRQWAQQIENSAVVVEDVTKHLSSMLDKKLVSPNTVEQAIEAVQGMSVRAKTELAKVEPEKQAEVLIATVNAAPPGAPPPTAPQIQAAAKPKPADPAAHAAPEVVYDGTGYPIPEKRLALWNRRVEIQALHKPLDAVRSIIRRIHEAGVAGHGDILFSDMGAQSVLHDLDGVSYSIRMSIPFAVCPDCQGHRADTCLKCKGMGLISEWTWKKFVSPDAKRLRELTVKSLAEKQT